MKKLPKEMKTIRWEAFFHNGELTKYDISNSGLMCNRDTKVLLTLTPNSQGYLVVKYTHNGVQYTRKIHRLVAITYIPNPFNKRTVNHRDGKKDNNFWWNLEWATHKENIRHAMNTGLMTNWAKGQNSGVAVYRDQQAHEVCQLLEDGMKISDIADTLSVPWYFVQRIKSGKKWVHISCEYTFPRAIPKPHRPREVTEKVLNLIRDGKDNPQIRQICDMPDTSSVMQYINRLRRYGSARFNDYPKNYPSGRNTHGNSEVGVGPQANGGDESLKSKREAGESW
jgi:hypothetical protein